MFALDLVRAHIQDLHREAALNSYRATATATASPLRRLVARTRSAH